MKFLTKDDIKSVATLPKMEKVEIPEWDGFVYVREMTSAARDAFEEMTFDLGQDGAVQKKMDNYRAKFVVFSACDESGDLIFSRDDVEWLGTKQASAVNKIFQVGSKLNGLTGKEAEKNFAKTTEDNPSSS